MAGIWNAVVLGLHLLAAGSAIVLALWQVAHRETSSKASAVTNAALAVSALWALATIALSGDHLVSRLMFSASYLAWLWVLYRMFSYDERDKSVGPVRPVVFALVFVEFLQLAVLAVRLNYSGEVAAQSLISDIEVLFRLLFCTGALVLVHNLYAGASAPARQKLRWPAAALGGLWLYDLNLFTVTYVAEVVPQLLVQLRSVAMIAMVALLGCATMGRESDLRFQPSRGFAFRSFSLLVIGAYLAGMVLIAQGIAYAGIDFGRFLQMGFVVLASAFALAFLPSKKMRGWLRVMLAKHLFQHRYDYRAEWMRFTDTIGRAGTQAAPLRERAIQAVADITDSPAGLLLTPRDDGGLALDASWQWTGLDAPALAMGTAGVRFFEESQYILDLDDLRAGRTRDLPDTASPEWLVIDQSAWAMVPLLHYERLVGIVVLARPPVARMLDWEDFDMLRVVGRQLASYLAEQSSQDALGEAQRFDEFNRRIAFVMHDIKNLVSQLSLLARNAEKHADKVDFRSDMILTLRNSTDKLQTLLARLSRYGAHGGAGELDEIALDELIERVTLQFKNKHQIIELNRQPCRIKADSEALEQALVHLVQNAIDASQESAPVLLDFRCDTSNAIIEIVDSGCGMSPEFVRTKLFKPFCSSKAGGFGIGAFEARELVRGMGGRLDVETREKIGTRFIVRLPLRRSAVLSGDAGHDTEVA